MEYTIRQATRLAEVSDWLDTLTKEEAKEAFDRCSALYRDGALSFLEAFESVRDNWKEGK
jgi:hypothetical protein